MKSPQHSDSYQSGRVGAAIDAARYSFSSSTAIDRVPLFGADISSVLIRGAETEEKRLREALGEKERELKELDARECRLKACLSFAAFMKEPLRLQRPRESLFNKTVDAVDSGDGFRRTGLDGDIFLFESDAFWEDTKTSSQVFLVQHDWKSAMSGTEFGDFQLPYPKCCFEFIISDHRVCALMGADGATEDRYMIVFFQDGPVWIMVGPFMADGNNWEHAQVKNKSEIAVPLANFLHAHVRALCVSLEAEIAVADTTRAPHKLNSRLVSTRRQPSYDYREIRLARRPRPSALIDSAAGSPKRLHFRRGHWRHFSNHRTWVKWCLVGDPDLGFIDKHYSL